MRDCEDELKWVEDNILPHADHRENFGVWNDNFIEMYKLRDKYTTTTAWSIPSTDVLNMIIEFLDGDSVIDVGCGHAFWAALLRNRGVRISAIDLQCDQRDHYARGEEDFMKVKLFNSDQEITEYLLKESPDALMFNWPSYDESWAFDYAVRILPSKIIYIGEGYSGCTADDAFHNFLENEYKVEEEYIPKFNGIHDYLHLCTKK